MKALRLVICFLWIAALCFSAKGQWFGNSDVTERGYTPSTVRRAFATARQNLNRRAAAGFGGVPREPGEGFSQPVVMHRYFSKSKEKIRQATSAQRIFEEATKVLVSEFGVTPAEIETGKQRHSLHDILGDDRDMLLQCETFTNVTDCDWCSPYRTIDGSCNNLNNPNWGMAGACFERLLEPAYADGISLPRIAWSGNPLPNPRMVSLYIHSYFNNPTDYTTHMFMQWGQFLDHDISLSPLNVDPDNNNEPLRCCPASPNNNPECLPVLLQQDDPFFSRFNMTCLENVRTVPCSTCTFGRRQQVNQLTAFIDASQVYSIALNESIGLRTLDGTGRLRSQINDIAGELLPGSTTPQNDECSFQDPTLNCFEAGDQRVNQHPALTSLHTLFLREHNRIADRLREMNPAWNDERLYQEARRIVGAEMQMITYNEFLPLVIGRERMQRFRLLVSNSGFTQYDRSAQPTLLNEFSAAAFRFGHSMVNSFFSERSSYNNSGYRLRDMFIFPFGLYRGQMESVLLGLAQSPAQKVDRSLVRDVTNHLYQGRGIRTGLDLASLNVLRGRDHGLPGYIEYVRLCGGPRITSFRDLDQLFQPEYSQRFQWLYESVEDIDLFSGGLAERPNRGAVVGPTFTCILGTQFYLLKYGDRFYFEHGDQTGSFTREQLTELRKVTLARVMCDNTEITQIQRNVMLYDSYSNPTLYCNNLPEMNLYAWME